VFVPAGKQRPLAYPEARRLRLVGVVLAGGGAGTVGVGGVVGITAMADPDGPAGWIRKQHDRIIGWIFDGEDGSQTTLPMRAQ